MEKKRFHQLDPVPEGVDYLQIATFLDNEVWKDGLVSGVTGSSGVRLFTFSVGSDAPAIRDGRVITDSFSGAISQIVSEKLIGYDLESVRVGSIFLLPEIGGYEYNKTIGSINFDEEYENVNIYITGVKNSDPVSEDTFDNLTFPIQL